MLKQKPDAIYRSRRLQIRVGAALSLAACAAALLTGCTPQQSSSGSSVVGSAVAEDKKPESEPTAKAIAADLYREAITNPSLHFADKSIETELIQTGEYTYALAEVDGLDAPALLLNLHGDMERWGGIDIVSVLYVNSDGELADYGETISRGTAISASYRGELFASAYGDGLIIDETVSGEGERRIDRLAFDGQHWGRLPICHNAPGYLREPSTAYAAPIEAERRELAWSAIDDQSVLNALEAGKWTSTVDSSALDAVSSAEEAGLRVYTGIIRVLGASEVCELQGISDPNPGYSEMEDPYTLLVFNGQADVDASYAGMEPGIERSTSPATMIKLETGDETWKAYDGQTVTIAVDPNATSFPSGTDLPLGEPYTLAWTVLR